MYSKAFNAMDEQERLRYKNTQIGYVTGGAGILGMLITYYSFMAEDGALGLFGAVTIGFFGVLTVLFSTLTVGVTDRTFRFYFGPGLWTHSFTIRDIQSVKVVRNPAYYGWGIRSTFHGWLYNVSGLRAVELDIKGEGTIRVGTNEPERLKEALVQATQPA
jgi:hypothetical protein